MVLLLLWRLDSRLNANASVRETPTGSPYASTAQSQAHSVLYVVCNKAVSDTLTGADNDRAMN